MEDLLAVEDEDAEHEEDEENLQPVGEDETHCRALGALHRGAGRVLQETSRRKIMVTSSLHEISNGNRGGDVRSNDDVNSISSDSDFASREE